MTKEEILKHYGIYPGFRSTYTYEGILSAMGDYAALIAAKPIVKRWVADFENEPPEYMQCCLITNQWGQVTEAQYTGEANIFSIGEERYEAKAWAPLPPPFA